MKLKLNPSRFYKSYGVINSNVLKYSFAFALDQKQTNQQLTYVGILSNHFCDHCSEFQMIDTLRAYFVTAA